MRLARHALSQAWILKGHFGFLCGINAEVQNHSPCYFNPQRDETEMAFLHGRS
jgi:hypothetical protein